MTRAFDRSSTTKRALQALVFAMAVVSRFAVPAFGGVEDSAPNGFKVLYLFTGVRSVLGNDGSAATSIHCTSIADEPTMVRVQWFDGGASVLTDNQLLIGAGASVTFSSRATEFYADNAAAGLTILMGSARVLSDGSTKIMCTGQVLDPIGDPPSYIVPLPGFSKAGAIR